MNMIACECGRSTKTVHDHIGVHNRAVNRSGFCLDCRRVKGRYDSMMAVRS